MAKEAYIVVLYVAKCIDTNHLSFGEEASVQAKIRIPLAALNTG